MRKIKFLGAAGTVTGSSYWIPDDANKGVLVDLGLFQGVEEPKIHNNGVIDIKAGDLTGVILTHAHLDHCGRLPLLLQAGYNGPIYMTEATKQLLELSLLDSAKVMAESERRRGGRKALFSEEEVERLMPLCRAVSYDRSLAVGNFEITLRDAGHILGSASVEIEDKREGPGLKKLVFSGDLGNTPQDLIRPTEAIVEAEAVVMESTYGDRIHGGEDPVEVLAEEIKAIEISGGTLLISAFSLERTQELLHKIDHLKKSGRVNKETLVFLDSPMAIKATMIFKHFPELYNEELSGHAKQDDPFDFPGLVLVEKRTESAKIKQIDRAKVIIAGSGMMTGGRILHHATEFLPLVTTRLLQVGFQAAGTIGRKIQNGEKRVQIDGTEIEVGASVRSITTMSAHADQPRLLRWLGQIKGVRKVFLTHGEELPRLVLSEKIKNDLGITEVVLPQMSQVADLIE